MTAIDFQKMRKELISLYEKFLKNPESDDVKEDLMSYEYEFGGLTAYNDYLKSQPVPKDIVKGLGGLSIIFEYGWFEDRDKIYTKEKIFSEAKRLLEELKKQDK